MTSHVDHAKHKKPHASQKSRVEPVAQSAGGEPDGRPTPVHHTPHVGPEDEPKGHPNSDRFQTEQAARPAKGKH
ncbi:hypothetical protein ACELLULO517_06915 [Acidisoma cellulosilytica]|uniref:Uncharacterized protein n=1 Tax=Acidisoma cellulosilyticum TaxID=2802395 RepID=A0A964E2T1_9PROT|nr:hypothetical protein [Acidisoma cellulosilyticum]MCB8879960.1 hypothetical protein [Acidisoma cellulosilyticum]